MAAMMSACLAINRDRSTAEESSKNKNKKNENFIFTEKPLIYPYSFPVVYLYRGEYMITQSKQLT